MVGAAYALRAMPCCAALVALRRQALFFRTLHLKRAPVRMLSFHQSGACYRAVLIVPFGSNVVTEPFCTTTSVPLAISSVT